MSGKYAGLRKADGTVVPEGEPWWVFRARDKLAIPCLDVYRALAVAHSLPQEFITEIDAHIARIVKWQYDHGSKLPD